MEDESKRIAPIERLLLRKEELAKSLGISARTIQEWERDFGLPTVRIGSSVRYSPKQVQKWIDRLHEQERDAIDSTAEIKE
ncbi:helix-turn-helix domain-containing protein [Bremerella sp. T1]|uniref:helix-turn-helix domain-containing protein n=1 Tax=Bremerella sp. TYQ1 TaxID=3119568 RepID=UPI001CCD82B7|nr:helix-turn-helix domain-containing protein [Bremerella volcania]UBM37385.1 helix-turn-helix domain-containing protein [Bremerella volcania]